MALLSAAGWRVVLVVATAGEQGETSASVGPDVPLGVRRMGETARAAECLGAQRVEFLGYHDSGLDGAEGGPTGGRPAGAFADAAVDEAAARLARILDEERPRALVGYDARGIYGHVDHLQVHRAGALAVRRLAARGFPLASYEATVDADLLRGVPRHVLQQAAGDDLDAGERPEAIDVTVRADASALLAKMAAMTAHASQIGPQWLDHAGFAGAYGREWFVRRGRPGLLDALAADLAV
jgi:LmbE family N-acetylglucosaminyl deacetylase